MNNLPIQTDESVVQQRDELEKKLADVVAESNAIKDAAKSLLSEASIVYSKYNETQQPDKDLFDMQTLHELQVAMSETQATDSFLAEVQAQGVDKLAIFAGKEYQRFVGDKPTQRKWKGIVMLCTDFAAQLRGRINDAQ